jgi:hypothetical protein
MEFQSSFDLYYCRFKKNWPAKLQVQFISRSVLDLMGGDYLWDAAKVVLVLPGGRPSVELDKHLTLSSRVRF